MTFVPSARRSLSVAGLVLAIVAVPLVAVLATAFGDFRDIYRLDISQGAPLELSHTSGYYPDAIGVQVEGTDGRPVYYTLDGSFPDPGLNPASTEVYDGPIEITPTTNTSTYAQFDYVLSDTGLPVENANTVTDSATVLRVRADNGPETVATYFIAAFDDIDLPIASLIVEPDYLWDNERGIYVAGKLWQDFLATGQSVEELRGRDWQGKANFIEQGDEWERPFPGSPENPVWLDWTRDINESWVSSQAGIRAHGGATRRGAQKSLRLYARTEYGDTRFPQDFFLDNDMGFPKRVLLRSGGNDNAVAKIRDSYFQSLGSELSVEFQRSQPAAVFINGEYWGVYFVRDRYDDRFFEQRFGVNPESVWIVDHELEVQEGPPNAAESLRELFNQLLDLPLGSAEAVELIDNEVDVTSLFDYVALQSFIVNTDWPRNNVLMWKTTEVSRDPMAEGNRWRFMLQDMDIAGYAEDVQTDSVTGLVDLPEPYLAREDAGIRLMMRHLLNSERRDEFFARYRQLLATDFSASVTLPALDSIAGGIESEIARDRMRWSGVEPGQEEQAVAAWAENIDQIRDFMSERPGIVAGDLADFESRLDAGEYLQWPEGIRRD